MDDLYDEFGNYIGPEISDSEEEVRLLVLDLTLINFSHSSIIQIFYRKKL